MTTPPHTFPPDWKEGVYQAILRRRDMRAFRPDPIPDAALARILQAAHHAGSVGFMQPWDFIVIRDRDVRTRIRDHVEEERLRAADGFAGDRKKTYLDLKLEGILDAPVNLCITCDPERAGSAVIGRNTIPETDLYSTCCAVQNLWLAARAEGIGVGWVSILRPERLREFLGIPDRVVPVAYLCVGYVDDFPETPTLETEGWRDRLSLADLVHAERWDAPAPPGLVASIETNPLDTGND